jgi:hypothetical protein
MTGVRFSSPAPQISFGLVFVMSTDDAAVEARSKLANLVLESYKFEYEDYTGWWNDIERKAQGTVAINGIILAGAFAFVRQLGPSTLLVEKWLLAAVVAFLLLSIGLSIVALFVGAFTLPPRADEIDSLVTDNVTRADTEGDLPARAVAITYDITPVWKECTSILRKSCLYKAKVVTAAQLCLFVAAILIAIITIRTIL